MTSFPKSAAIIFLMVSSSAFAQVPDWSVSETSGSVTVVRARGDSVKATRGMAVKHGDAILTGPKSRAVMVRKSEFVTVSPNSRITVAPPKAGSMVQIVQKNGTAVYKIQKKATPHFAVETPYLAAVVKGTTFSVNVGTTGAAVQVTEGRVQVVSNQGSAEYLLTPGKIGLVDAGSPNRLTVQGDGRDIIIGGDATASSGSAQSAASDVHDDVIQTDVTEGALRLEKVTDGLISGDASISSLAMLDGAYDTLADSDGQDGSSADSGDGAGGGKDGSGDAGDSAGDAPDTGGKDDDDDKGGKDDDDDKGGKDDDDDKGGKDDDDDKGGKDDDDDKGGKDDDDDKGGKDDDDDKGGKDDDDDKGGKDDDDDKGGKDDD